MVWLLPDWIVDKAISAYNWATGPGEAPDVGPIELTPSIPGSEIESEAGEV
jgi:hypothetical protein